MFNIGKTDEYGRQKRIEHRGRYLRASRTGGVSLRAQTKAAGLNVTGNTKHGVRVSTRVAKGTNVALQNGSVRLRGRYGKGPTKLNLSKSGMSVSTKNSLGTFNWTNPNRSSAKIAGVQMRGKKAANLQMIYLLVMLVVNLVKFAAVALVWILQALVALARVLALGAVSETQALIEAARTLRARRRVKAGEELLARVSADAPLREVRELEAALLYVVGTWGRGLEAADGKTGAPAGNTGATGSTATGNPGAGAAAPGPALDDLITRGTPREEARQMKRITAALAARYAAVASQEEIGEMLLRLDDAARADGRRTVLQEKLIDVYADTAHPVFEVEAEPDS